MSAPPELEKPLKRRRITRACDYCHQRSVRCQKAGEGPSCRNCLDFGQPCTFNRVPKKRGAPSKMRLNDDGDSEHRPSPQRPPSASLPLRDGPLASGVYGDGIPSPGADISPGFLRDQASMMADSGPVATQARIMDLVELYFEIVYPIFPFFHRPSFLRRISRAEYTTDRSLFGVTMAVCALVSGRVRDGAVSNPRWDATELSQTPPQVFYEKAREQLRPDPMRVDLNTLRSHAILAITSIQFGFVREMHYHIGQYHTLVAMDSLHDEAEWPQDMGVIEREERRRLFWSIYTLDIYMSIVWGGVVRGREQQFKVSYPIEVDDEFITDTSTTAPSQTGAGALTNPGGDSGPNWLYGWNFTTDLYRILEHALARFRESKSNRSRQTSFLHEIFFRHRAENSITVASVRDNVMQMYLALPECFKQIPRDTTFDPRKDLFGFQAANITATVQLLRMVLFSVEEGSVSLIDRCQIASEVINAFWSIPDAYQQAISAPLLHHLGGIGFILGGSALGLSENTGLKDGEWLYDRLRSVLLDLARLLARLEGLLTSAHVSERLEKQVARIDERIMAMRRQQQQSAVTERPVPEANRGAPQVLQTYSHGQAYNGNHPHPQPPQAFEQTGINGTQMPGPMSDWGLLSFPDDIFGDLTWAFNSV